MCMRSLPAKASNAAYTGTLGTSKKKNNGSVSKKVNTANRNV